jgi:hypothetical protein
MSSFSRRDAVAFWHRTAKIIAVRINRKKLSAGRALVAEIKAEGLRLTKNTSMANATFFFQERKKFLRLPRSIGSLCIFPDVFYFTQEGEARKSSKERILSITSMTSEDWDCVRHCDEGRQYCEFFDTNAYWITRHGYIDAYRIAARKVLLDLPYSSDREQAMGYFSSILYAADDRHARDVTVVFLRGTNIARIFPP